MKKNWVLGLMIAGAFAFAACEADDENTENKKDDSGYDLSGVASCNYATGSSDTDTAADAYCDNYLLLSDAMAYEAERSCEFLANGGSAVGTRDGVWDGSAGCPADISGPACRTIDGDHTGTAGDPYDYIMDTIYYGADKIVEFDNYTICSDDDDRIYDYMDN